MNLYEVTAVHKNNHKVRDVRNIHAGSAGVAIACVITKYFKGIESCWIFDARQIGGIVEGPVYLPPQESGEPNPVRNIVENHLVPSFQEYDPQRDLEHPPKLDAFQQWVEKQRKKLT
jgi:hypothetical protein